MRVANFIIGGTEKAGTTSVFSYLAQHPDVAVSRRKETNFFRATNASESDYALEFPDASKETILLEASPAYLGEAETVAPRMHSMLPDVKLLFILRDPVDRFVSSYHFHRERLNLPKELQFRDYLHRCLDYANSRSTEERYHRGPEDAAPLDDWYLSVLQYGRYAHYLRCYFALFAREQIRVMFYDNLRDNPLRFMQDVSSFLHIDPDFWSTISFERMNASFAGRRRWLHRLALFCNDRFEPLLRRRPRLKRSLLDFYKAVNRATDSDRTLASSDRALLEDFYAPANDDLEVLLGTALPKGWAKAALPPRQESDARAGAGAEFAQ